ncbi:hypothetical protein QYM36_015007 [Artemia franciscana]|uniref:Suppressor of white apricot N-terminal domain-containing protein n=1 Tax=Artemia franciscana TaxID=6661 RepID=A0AA88HK59_ARTSF|nr:hypothetical protein QYM36_015007 [Artemia franciscana]
MWAEARKHEKKIRGMMVDHRKRAERRREYYEKIKADPTQFLQVHGRKCKIHIDPTIAAAADSPATMMPWQGRTDCMIDRFDSRAHLDIIKEYKPPQKEVDAESLSWQERQTNYERYRIVIQNDFLGIHEEKFLHQIFLEEHFGVSYNKPEEEKKKALSSKRIAIGYNYDEGSTSGNAEVYAPVKIEESNTQEENEEDIEDIDLDLAIAVDALSTEQMHTLNQSGQKYGLGRQDFMSLLSNDLTEQEELRLQKIEAEEKLALQGRRTRRERRLLKDLRLAGRSISPPSYAARSSPKYEAYKGGSSIYLDAGIGEDPDAEEKAAGARAFIDAIPVMESPKRCRSRSVSRSRSPYEIRRVTRRVSKSPSVVSKLRRSSERSKRRYSSSRSRSRRRITSRERRGSRSRSVERRRSRSRSRRRSPARHRRMKSRSTSRRRRSFSKSRSRSRGKEISESKPRRSNSRGRSSITGKEKRSERTPTPKTAPSKSSPRKSATPSNAPRKRYYGRKKEGQSSSSEENSDIESSSQATSAQAPSVYTKAKLPGLDYNIGSKKGIAATKVSKQFCNFLL